VLAHKVCAQVTTASACERNWSAYDHVVSRKRNKLDPARAEKLVFVFLNLRVVYRSRDMDLSKKYEAACEAIFSDSDSEPESSSEGLEEEEDVSD
jgi:hypothetical protein